MKVHEEGKIALVQSVLQFRNPLVLHWGGEGDEIEIGVGPGGPFHARAVGPHRDAGDEAAQEREQRFSLLRRDVDRGGHSQVVPVIVW